MKKRKSIPSTILNHIYSYKQNPELENHISKTIYAENISYGNHSTTIGYNTDSLGRITLISSSLFNNGHSYSYDYKGYLIGEDNISYTYDDNGNILSCGNDTFTYDSVIKDRLKKVNNQTIEYSLDKPLYPINYDGWNYTYKGKRLKEVTKNNNKTITYLYDDLGFITKKTIQESNNTYIINYFYDDNKLITEIKDNIRNDYIYDEYDELYGFIQNNTNIYYYVRDYIGNILGIVDNSGDLKVKYNYDAYGNIISITGESMYNPFRYKGYYYDNDIEMYYCHNRFYNPKWRRWLTPDSPNYLNIDTPSGMNLFIYCNNNPVMYSDGEGNFPGIITAMLIGAGIGALIGAVGQAGADVLSNLWSRRFNISDWSMSSWQTYVGAIVGGAIGGALTPILGPVSTATINGAVSSFVGMGLENITGESNYSFGEMFTTSVFAGAFSGLTAAIIDKVKIPGITSGRGSLSSIQKQINTKLVRNQISRISLKTFGKMLLLELCNSLPSNFLNSFTNGLVLSPITDSF